MLVNAHIECLPVIILSFSHKSLKHKAKDIVTVIGEHDLRDKKYGPKEVEVEIENIITHGGYDPKSKFSSTEMRIVCILVSLKLILF